MVLCAQTTGAKVPAGLLPTPLPIPNGPFKPPRLKISKLPSQSPCNNYYLAPQGCRKHDCLFRHDFDFDLEAWKVFPLFVKSTICGEAAANGYCERGEQCIKGHRCVSFRCISALFSVLTFLFDEVAPTLSGVAHTATLATTTKRVFRTPFVLRSQHQQETIPSFLQRQRMKKPLPAFHRCSFCC
jgi:hypothetical protein